VARSEAWEDENMLKIRSPAYSGDEAVVDPLASVPRDAGVEAKMTKTPKLLGATLIGLASLVLGSRPVSAEWFADIFAGASVTESHDLKLNDQGVGQSTFRGVDFDTSLSWGGRFGHYFDALPFLGLAVDFFHFSPNISPQSVHLEAPGDLPCRSTRALSCLLNIDLGGDSPVTV
jgi:hypothetical protein